MASTPQISLNNGKTIPQIGLGTWQSPAGQVENAVEFALKGAGYRHIDCAQAYGNEKEVGAGLKASGVPRSEVFITSKVWGTYHSRVEEALDATLSNLGTDYLDLYLIHWPVPMNPKGNHPFFPTLPDGKRDVDADQKIEATWASMEAMVEKGKVRAIGFSNFSQWMAEKILPVAKIQPAASQLEIHLYNPQLKLVEFYKSKGIAVQAYSPLGSTDSPLLKDEVVTKIAERLKISNADVLIGWLLNLGLVVLPKSVTNSRISSNLTGSITAKDLLTPEDVETLSSVAASGKQKRLITPPWPVKLGFEDWI